MLATRADRQVVSSCDTYTKHDGKEVVPSGNYSMGPGKWLDD